MYKSGPTNISFLREFNVQKRWNVNNVNQTCEQMKICIAMSPVATAYLINYYATLKRFIGASEYSTAMSFC